MISLHRYFTAKASLRYNPNMVATTIERGRKTDAPTSFWAVSGGTQAMGDTPGAALEISCVNSRRALAARWSFCPGISRMNFSPANSRSAYQELIGEKRRRSLTNTESEELAVVDGAVMKTDSHLPL
jgi:hypothetical protein